ncbi:S-4TM family putative pore-forming effector [Micromonospora sp. M12]
MRSGPRTYPKVIKGHFTRRRKRVPSHLGGWIYDRHGTGGGGDRERGIPAPAAAPARDDGVAACNIRLSRQGAATRQPPDGALRGHRCRRSGGRLHRSVGQCRHRRGCSLGGGERDRARFLVDGQLRRAAVLQEMFDVRLFRLPWNAVAAGDPVGLPEVSRLDRAFRGDEQYLRDYYEVPDLPRPYDVLACQQQNLGWGARVRRRYAYTVLAGVALWATVGLSSR